MGRVSGSGSEASASVETMHQPEEILPPLMSHSKLKFKPTVNISQIQYGAPEGLLTHCNNLGPIPGDRAEVGNVIANHVQLLQRVGLGRISNLGTPAASVEDIVCRQHHLSILERLLAGHLMMRSQRISYARNRDRPSNTTCRLWSFFACCTMASPS